MQGLDDIGLELPSGFGGTPDIAPALKAIYMKLVREIKIEDVRTQELKDKQQKERERIFDAAATADPREIFKRAVKQVVSKPKDTHGKGKK